MLYNLIAVIVQKVTQLCQSPVWTSLTIPRGRHTFPAYKPCKWPGLPCGSFWLLNLQWLLQLCPQERRAASWGSVVLMVMKVLWLLRSIPRMPSPLARLWWANLMWLVAIQTGWAWDLEGRPPNWRRLGKSSKHCRSGNLGGWLTSLKTLSKILLLQRSNIAIKDEVHWQGRSRLVTSGSSETEFWTDDLS